MVPTPTYKLFESFFSSCTAFTAVDQDTFSWAQVSLTGWRDLRFLQFLGVTTSSSWQVWMRCAFCLRFVCAAFSQDAPDALSEEIAVGIEAKAFLCGGLPSAFRAAVVCAAQVDIARFS